MSLAPDSFECERCGKSSSTLKLWGDFYYISDEIRIPIERDFGWCSRCDSLEPVEDLGHQDEIAAKITAKQAQSKRLQRTAILRALNAVLKSRHEQIAYLESRIEALQCRLDFLKGRSSPP